MKKTRRLVLVTGASRGLGRLVAEKFWDAGDDLALISRNTGELEDVVESLNLRRKPAQNITYQAFDLNNLEEIPKLVACIRDTAGNPDVVINNAAIQGPIGPFISNRWTEWQHCLNVCLLAPIRICQETLPAMIEQNYGRIVNISGGGATAPRPNFSSYATAKCGLVRFTETIAHEISKFDLTMNCVAPGAMNSTLTRKILDSGIESAGPREYEAARHLVDKNSQNEIQAADLVYLLTSDEFSSINGRLLSAVWDPFRKIPEKATEIEKSDVYTLRRIIPDDRCIDIS